MAVSSLSILGVLSVIAIITALLLCYLKGPVKTPAVLVSTFRYRSLETLQKHINLRQLFGNKTSLCSFVFSCLTPEIPCKWLASTFCWRRDNRAGH